MDELIRRAKMLAQEHKVIVERRRLLDAENRGDEVNRAAALALQAICLAPRFPDGA